MLDFENDKNPYREKRNAILPWKRIAEFYCASSTDILSVGSEIMGKGFGAKDSLHIACAIESKCDYFITTDDKITNKKVDGIRIINPIDFVIEMENLK
jgi:predicted nucleic acid-binding protein